ncbi:MAG: HlyD family efflux transporter periplasmic adaptor subunit [Candidatus Marinimicrobia bacterium]|nr:HlyD family efflux transporter periplasmic adaptor subunit [Candidatus Neomarinimicrobiota bacterium]
MTYKIKQISILGAIAIISVSLMMLLISFKSPPKRKPSTDNRPVIGVMEVNNSQLQITIPVIGRLTAQKKVDVLAEVSGVLEINQKEFLTGTVYQKGEVMLRINREETELNLRAQRSNLLTAIASLLPELKFDYPESYKSWNNYLQNCNSEEITKPLPDPLNEREKLFVAARGIYSTYYQIKAQESKLEKYTIRAPFNGVLIQSNITPGNLVRVGQSLGVFINPEVYDLETSVSIGEVKHIKVGDKVMLTSESISGSWQGTVTRINVGMDEISQMVKVFVQLSAPELREGMFLRGAVQTSSYVHGIRLPRKMLYNGNITLQVIDGVIHYREVDVVSTMGEYAIVNGLEDGVQLSTKTLSLYDGTEVKVQPSVETQASESVVGEQGQV